MDANARKQLEQDRAELVAAREQALANANACLGAIQYIDRRLADEPVTAN